MPARRAVAAALMLIGSTALAQAPSGAGLQVPEKTIPVPQTVSPELQKIIALPYPAVWNIFPPNAEGWKAQIGAIEAANVNGLPALRDMKQVKVGSENIGGVKVLI